MTSTMPLLSLESAAMLWRRRGEEEEVFITSAYWRGKHNSLSRGAGTDQPEYFTMINLKR